MTLGFADMLTWQAASAALTLRWLPAAHDGEPLLSGFFSNDHGKLVADEACVRCFEPRELCREAWDRVGARRSDGVAGLLRDLVGVLLSAEHRIQDPHLWTWTAGLLGGDLLAAVRDRDLDPATLLPELPGRAEWPDEHVHFTALPSRIAGWCVAQWPAPAVLSEPCGNRPRARPVQRPDRDQVPFCNVGRAVRCLLIDAHATGRGPLSARWHEFAGKLIRPGDGALTLPDAVLADFRARHGNEDAHEVWLRERGPLADAADPVQRAETMERGFLARTWRSQQCHENGLVRDLWWRYVGLRCLYLATSECRPQMTGLGEFSRDFERFRRKQTRSFRVAAGTELVALRTVLPTGDYAIFGAMGNIIESRVFFTPHRVQPRFDDVGSADAILQDSRLADQHALALNNYVEQRERNGLPAIHGVDVASKERGWHPFCWRPLYEAAAEHGLEVAMHVGEDMDDMLTGLRLIDEALTMLTALRPEPTRKPRLGHTLAIRMDVRAWYTRRRAIRAQPWEHVLDLLWAWQCGAGFQNTVHDRFQRTHSRLTCDAADLAELARRYECKVPLCPQHPPSSELRIAGLGHLVIPACAFLGEPVGPPDEAWFAMVSALQADVRRRVADKAIVEVCPSSNAAISGLGWSWALDFGDREPKLEVLYGSDDPGVLDTNIALEMAKIAAYDVAK